MLPFSKYLVHESAECNRVRLPPALEQPRLLQDTIYQNSALFTTRQVYAEIYSSLAYDAYTRQLSGSLLV